MPFDLIRACATGSVTTRFAQPANIRQVLDMRTIQIPAVVRVRGRGAAVELPDFFAMIDQQARMVVSLARTVGEILQGKESAYSVRLLDLEQRREELRRRNLAAVGSAFALTCSVKRDPLNRRSARPGRGAPVPDGARVSSVAGGRRRSGLSDDAGNSECDRESAKGLQQAGQRLAGSRSGC